MKSNFARVLRGALLLTISLTPIWNSSAEAWQNTDCQDLAAYIGEVEAIGDRMTSSGDDVFSSDNLESWTSTDFTIASDQLEDFKIELDKVEPPPIASEYHDLMLRSIGLLSQAFDTMATAGVFGILVYSEQVDELESQIAEVTLALELKCYVALYDHDDDGIEEIGSADPPSESTSALTQGASANGSRSDPFPIGTLIELDQEWEITVLNVVPDGTDLVLNENQFNEPPTTGQQFFIARIRVTYTGNDSDQFSLWRLSVVGQSSIAYDQFEDDCGVVPDELPDRELFTNGTIEGNVCWSVRAEDADSLVMYDNEADNDDRVFMSLQEKPLQSPIPTQTSAVAAPPTRIPITPILTFGVPTIEPTVTRTPTPASSSINGILLEARDIAFEPTDITIRTTELPVTITMENTGAAEHDFVIDALDIEVVSAPGETVEIEIPIGTAPGEYQYYCSVPGHKEAGMVGTLVVE